jgi:hypothetical protein
MDPNEAQAIKSMKLPVYRSGAHPASEGAALFTIHTTGPNMICGQAMPHLPYRWGVDPAGHLCPFAYNTNRGITGEDLDAKYDRVLTKDAVRGGWRFLEDDEVEIHVDERGDRYGLIVSDDLVREIIKRRAKSTKEREDASQKDNIARLIEAQRMSGEAQSKAITEAIEAIARSATGRAPRPDKGQ